MKSNIFLLKEELHTLKTKKQLFPEGKKHFEKKLFLIYIIFINVWQYIFTELKHPTSFTTSTPKKMRKEITVNILSQDTVYSVPSTSQICEQSSLQEDDFCMQVLEEKTRFIKQRVRKKKQERRRKTKNLREIKK